MLPPVYFLAAIVSAVILHYVLPIDQLIRYPWRFIGLIPLVTGIVLNLLADHAFKKYETTVKPFAKSSVLVTGGVFAVSRNPMYAGMMLILFGIAVMLGSLMPFVIVAFTGFLLNRLFVVPEEKMLEEIFGDEFRQYRRRVRKWI